MADIVNLRKARKAKARVQEGAKAAENRIKFGRSKAERTASEAQEHLTGRQFDAHRLKGGDESG